MTMNTVNAADELASIIKFALFFTFVQVLVCMREMCAHIHISARALSRFRAAKERKQKTGLDTRRAGSGKKNWPWSSACLSFCTGKGEGEETETVPVLRRVSLSVQVSPGKGEVAEKLALVFSVSPFLSRYLPARGRWQRNWPLCSDCLPFCPGISRQGEVAETETGPGLQRVSLSFQVSPGKGSVAD